MKSRIRELLLNKYGEDKILLGCEIVTSWVSHEIKDERFSQDDVFLLIDGKQMTEPVAEALRKLFGLKNMADLFY